MTLKISTQAFIRGIGLRWLSISILGDSDLPIDGAVGYHFIVQIHV